MGTSQSSTATTSPTESLRQQDMDPMTSSHPKVDISSQESRKKKIPKDLSGPALIEYKCRKKKKAWSACVGGFYNRFSSGKVLEDEEADCDDLFDQYRQCYVRGMLKERQKKGLDPPKEGTLLAELAKEEELDWSNKQ